MAKQLHDYQHVAVDHLRRNPAAGLFLDMGLGKTAAVLTALTPEHLPALVVAPKRVAENVWETEGRIWRPDLKIRVAMGKPARRADELNSAADIHVIGRDNILDLLNHRHQWRTLIVDELSGFKSPRSVRFKTTRKIRGDFDYRWGLTGTPSPNGLLDLWSQLFLLDGGERLSHRLTDYRSRYFRPGHQLPSGVITEWLLRPGADKRIHTLIDDICLSMTTDGRIDLPEVTHNVVTVSLPPAAREAYKTFKKDLVLNLGLIDDDLGRTIHTAANTAVLSTKLAQISAGFIFHDDNLQGEYTVLHRERIGAVQEIIDGTGSPVLLAYRFRPEAEMLKQSIPGVHTINEPNIVDRWNAGDVPVLMAHPQSVGHGLNLQDGGHTAVWSSLPWSLEEWDQFNKRLNRQGQKNPVIIHSLVAPRTVDTNIVQALINKTSVQEALLAHLESPL